MNALIREAPAGQPRDSMGWLVRQGLGQPGRPPPLMVPGPPIVPRARG
jgi:hypothetical protein